MRKGGQIIVMYFTFLSAVTFKIRRADPMWLQAQRESEAFQSSKGCAED
jgi:hypothetical protein